jgi:hypothetical protein
MLLRTLALPADVADADRYVWRPPVDIATPRWAPRRAPLPAEVVSTLLGSVATLIAKSQLQK